MPATWLAFRDGDRSAVFRLLEEALADDDDLAAVRSAGMVAIHSATSGHYRDVETAVAALTDRLGRHGVEYTVATGSMGFSAHLQLLIGRGQLQEARQLVADIPTGIRFAAVLATAANIAELGYFTFDEHLLEMAAALHEGDVPHLVECVAHLVVLHTELFAGRYEQAAGIGRKAFATWVTTVGLATVALRPLGLALLACGQRDELREALERVAADIERVGRPPLPVAHLHHLQALLARGVPGEEVVVEYAHACLRTASEHGFALLVLDSLELLAESAASNGDTRFAARVFGATTARRHEIGYRACYVPDPATVEAAVEQVRVLDPDSFAEGGTLSVAEAVAYVQRSRGERGRPSVGWASLTPTEQQVAALVSEGLSNGAVAKRLFVSVPTVKTHLTHIYAKTGTANRTELALRHPAR